MDLRYTLGLDLGQAKDYTAVAIGQWVRDEPPYTVDVRHLQRFPLGTPYPVIVGKIEDMLNRAPLCGECDLVIDATGVGRPYSRDHHGRHGRDPRVSRLEGPEARPRVVGPGGAPSSHVESGP